MGFDVVGIDMPCWDLAVNLDEYPLPNTSGPVNRLSWQGGGKVSTGIIAAARLGAKCSISGAVGDDLFGQLCIRDFKEHGIHTGRLLVRQDATTGFSVVISDKNTMGRSILYSRGTAKNLSTIEFDKEILKDTRYLFISSINDTTVMAVKAAREEGIKIMIDADSYTDDLPALIPMIDVFVGSEFVYSELFDNPDQFRKNLESIYVRGPKIVVFTFGEKGSCGFCREGYFEVSAYKVKVEDTLGAGDVFHGAFVVGLLKGFSAEETTRFASAVSAIKCTKIGGRAGIPDYDTAIEFMKTGLIHSDELDERVNKYERGVENV